MKAPEIPTSWGELIDKITILEIKSSRLKSQRALANVQNELTALNGKIDSAVTNNMEVQSLKGQLVAVNEALWDILDRNREKEAALEFDEEFIELSRAVARYNDERARIKREINILLASDLMEEKSFLPAPTQ